MGLRTPLLALATAALATQGAAEMTAAEKTQDEIRLGYLEHAALAQFHRWYQFYERPEGGVENALDILSEDVTVTSGLGTANGHEEYRARVTQLPAEWKNAHHVRGTQIAHGEDGAMTLTADIVYQNQGLLPDGAVREAELTYTVELSPTEGLLPKLSEVTIAQDSESTGETFEDAYAENRALSLVHAYLAVIEDPSRDPEPMRELFAEDFALNFSSGAITTFEGFAEWLAGPGSQVAASTHIIENLSVEAAGDDRFEVSMEFDWAGFTPDGTDLLARTKHDWVVVNDPTERFARIERVDVEVLEPFRPKDG